MNSSQFHAGEWVRIRSKEEILKTLDKNGRLEGLPFMPEMFDCCGKEFRVYKRAHKTCDPPNGMGGRGMHHAVHLEGVRCNGSAHGGCQARCLIFWKDEWLEGSNRAQGTVAAIASASPTSSRCGCSEKDVQSGTCGQTDANDPNEPVYVCQSTHLAQATYPLRWWDFRQYVEDVTSRNTSLSRLAVAFFVFSYEQVVSAGLGFGSVLRWLFDVVQKQHGGIQYPWRLGKVPAGAKTPSAKLDVQPGDLVKIRSYEEILETINEDGRNRGMSFDAEMVPFCGGTYRVLDRVNRIINEKTGKMQDMKNDCIILEDVVCLACYSKHRRFCPRSIFPYWREIWLERVAPDSLSTGAQ